jgi:hypothetical protein
MMSTFIIAFVFISIAVIGMAIGVLAGRPAIKGSCGGLNQIGLGGDCGGGCSSEDKEVCEAKKAMQTEGKQD